ncbi:MAG: RpiB/LacA/LacB family sugar-phosphate isomerase [Candidatus Pacearchaeota archaeon]
MKIILGSDHGGFYLKEEIKKYLEKQKIPYEDIGPFRYDKDDDYPDYTIPVALKVAKNKNYKGIIFGFSGQGELIAANKVSGIRAALYYGGNKEIIKLSREHNNSNILSLSGGFLSKKEAIEAIDLWLKTPFTNATRHKRRLKKISNFERKKLKYNETK